MKIVQSFWTAPAPHADVRRMISGFNTATHHYLSWVVSAFSAYKSSGNLALVTDLRGAKVLVDELKLPYTEVHTNLETCPVHPEMWVYGKLMAYVMQTEPFLHIDGDVFLWCKLPDKFLKSQVLVQHAEHKTTWPDWHGVYGNRVAELQTRLKWTPKSYRLPISGAYNMGIFGGTNVAAINTYARNAIHLVSGEANIVPWAEMGLMPGHIGRFVTCVEQLTLYAEMKHMGVPVMKLFSSKEERGDVNYCRTVGFTHLGEQKREVGEGGCFDRLRERCARDYPEQLEIIDGWNRELSGNG